MKSGRINIKMRVLFVTHYLALYGANKSLLGLISCLQKYGVDCRVLVPGEGALVEELKKLRIKYYILPVKSWVHEPLFVSIIKAPFKFLFNLSLLPYLAMSVKSWGPDLIYTNSSVIPIGFFLSKLLCRPHVWHIREFAWLDYGLKYDLGMKLTSGIFKASDAVICVSNAIENYFFSKTESDKIHVVSNGVLSGSEAITLRTQSRVPFSNPVDYVFSIVGLIIPAKGQKEAIKALSLLAKDYPNVRLLIAGTGNPEYIEELAASAENNANVEFLGYVDNPFEVFSRSDAVLVCSKNEAFGRTTAEAMASTRPVIGFNAAGTSEIIKDNVSGLLYNTTLELVSCMRKLIDNPQFALRLGQAGGELAKEKYTIEANASQIYKILSGLVFAGGRQR